MRSIDHPAEILRRESNAAVNAGRASLRGFWRDKHNVPSEPKLIVGDREKFEKDLAAYRRRQRKVFQGSATRWWVEAHVIH